MTVISPDQLKQLQSLMKAGRFDEALRQGEALLGETGEHQDTLYMCAVCARYLKEFDKASALIERLKRSAPDFGRGFQEEGHLRLATGDERGAR